MGATLSDDLKRDRLIIAGITGLGAFIIGIAKDHDAHAGQRDCGGSVAVGSLSKLF